MSLHVSSSNKTTRGAERPAGLRNAILLHRPPAAFPAPGTQTSSCRENYWRCYTADNTSDVKQVKQLCFPPWERHQAAKSRNVLDCGCCQAILSRTHRLGPGCSAAAPLFYHLKKGTYRSKTTSETEILHIQFHSQGTTPQSTNFMTCSQVLCWTTL